MAGNTVLVMGATGSQGGAVARALLKRSRNVRAFVRDPNKPAALELQKLGAELHQGDFNDPDSLTRAMQNIDGVYSVQNFFETGFDGEVAQGRMVADLAKQNSVNHIVYGSVIGADRDTKIPHFESKWQIEQHIVKTGIPSTMLRAVAYMDNFETFGWYKDGALTVPMKPDAKWQTIATKDIGEFAALAFENPSVFAGKALEIAGDEFTMPEAAETFSRVLGKPVKYVQVPMKTMHEQNEELALMFEWFNELANFADLTALKALNKELWNLEDWLNQSSIAKQTV